LNTASSFDFAANTGQLFVRSSRSKKGQPRGVLLEPQTAAA
jgi:hypothetical protein